MIDHIPHVFVWAMASVGVLVMAGVAVRRRVAAAGGGALPDEGITVRAERTHLVDDFMEIVERFGFSSSVEFEQTCRKIRHC